MGKCGLSGTELITRKTLPRARTLRSPCCLPPAGPLRSCPPPASAPPHSVRSPKLARWHDHTETVQVLHRIRCVVSWDNLLSGHIMRKQHPNSCLVNLGSPSSPLRTLVPRMRNLNRTLAPHARPTPCLNHCSPGFLESIIKDDVLDNVLSALVLLLGPRCPTPPDAWKYIDSVGHADLLKPDDGFASSATIQLTPFTISLTSFQNVTVCPESHTRAMVLREARCTSVLPILKLHSSPWWRILTPQLGMVAPLKFTYSTAVMIPFDVLVGTDGTWPSVIKASAASESTVMMSLLGSTGIACRLLFFLVRLQWRVIFLGEMLIKNNSRQIVSGCGFEVLNLVIVLCEQLDGFLCQLDESNDVPPVFPTNLQGVW